jgi:hypothetical protein
MALLGASSDTMKCSHTIDLTLFVFSVEATEVTLLADSTGKMSLIKNKMQENICKYYQILQIFVKSNSNLNGLYLGQIQIFKCLTDIWYCGGLVAELRRQT